MVVNQAFFNTLLAKSDTHLYIIDFEMPHSCAIAEVDLKPRFNTFSTADFLKSTEYPVTPIWYLILFRPKLIYF